LNLKKNDEQNAMSTAATGLRSGRLRSAPGQQRTHLKRTLAHLLVCLEASVKQFPVEGAIVNQHFFALVNRLGGKQENEWQVLVDG
jgi:hypothetical protein